MAQTIETGSDSSAAISGMIALRSGREKATSARVAALGGGVECLFLTSGDSDFIMRVTADDILRMPAALKVVGASGAATHPETVQCFSSAKFLQAQKDAGGIALKYPAPN